MSLDSREKVSWMASNNELSISKNSFGKMVYSDFISNPIPTSRKKNKIRHNADKNISYIKNNRKSLEASDFLPGKNM